MQVDIQENGPADFQNLALITVPELREIRRIWVHDKHEFDDSVPRIYEEVIGKKFDDPEWIGNEAFGEDEWNILLETCHDLYQDEELMPELLSSIIDVEVEAQGMAERKGILDKLDVCVRKSFYKDEDDATAYYSNRVGRQRDTGAKYNEKFFAESTREQESADGKVITSDEDVDA